MYERKDAYYERAKRSGYRSRAAYKLEELTRQFKLLRGGEKVVDLGAWPGGWLQVAADVVGPRGKVVGVDLNPIDPLAGKPQVTTLVANLQDDSLAERIDAILGGRADVVLSDLAPKLTGVRDRDVVAAAELANLAFITAAKLLRPGGCLLMKLFMNTETSPFLGRLRECFREVRSTRPDATRKGSAEIYVVAKGFRGRQPTD